MSIPAPRAMRVSTEISHLLATIIEREYGDPRLHLVTVTEVQLSRDLRHARVMVSSADPARVPGEALAALRHAGSRLRRDLAGRIRLRVVPRLSFEWDERGEEDQRLQALIRQGLPPNDGEA